MARLVVAPEVRAVLGGRGERVAVASEALVVMGGMEATEVLAEREDM